ncbi:MAG: hypothetical protein LBI80_01825 [Endomicrobium sp.]|jgi:hypothetical protein|nr:hypothetical protein [Endomicrobium sp.]
MFKRFSFFIVLLYFFSVQCFALTLSDGTEVSDLVSLVDYGYSKLSLGLEFSNYKYREVSNEDESEKMRYEDEGGEIMSLTGPKKGFVMEYFLKVFGSKKEQQSFEVIFLSLQFWYMQGYVKYKGHFDDGTPVEDEDQEKDYYFEYRLLCGSTYSFFNIKSITETLYLGIGHRHLVNESSYNRVSRYLYVPIGLTTDIKLGMNWSLIINSEINFLIDGVQNTDFNTKPRSRFIQNAGHGARLGITANKKLKKERIFFGPFIRYWDIACSEKLDYYLKEEEKVVEYLHWEPKNYTVEYGFKVGIDFDYGNGRIWGV